MSFIAYWYSYPKDYSTCTECVSVLALNFFSDIMPHSIQIHIHVLTNTALIDVTLPYFLDLTIWQMAHTFTHNIIRILHTGKLEIVGPEIHQSDNIIRTHFYV